VLTGFALALATDRALIVEWAASSEAKCDERRPPTVNFGIEDKDCDVTTLADLYDLPFDHSRPDEMPSCEMNPDADFVVRGDRDEATFWDMLDAGGFDETQPFVAVEAVRRYRAETRVLCVKTDRFAAWTLTCAAAPGLFPREPWATYGLLQDYLFWPVAALRERIRTALLEPTAETASSNYVEAEAASPCAVGIHLRKLLNSTGHRGSAAARVEFDAALNGTLPGAPRGDDNLVSSSSTRLHSTPYVLVASDPFSVALKAELDARAKELGFRLVDVAKFETRITRATAEGILDAVLDLSLLALCDVVLPLQIEHSTFHDVALARMAWRRHLVPETFAELLSWPNRHGHEGHADPFGRNYDGRILPPSLTCPPKSADHRGLPETDKLTNEEVKKMLKRAQKNLTSSSLLLRRRRLRRRRRSSSVITSSDGERGSHRSTPTSAAAASNTSWWTQFTTWSSRSRGPP